MFFLKPSKGKVRIGIYEYDKTLVDLTKYMINIAYNARVFRDDGTFNTDEKDASVPFNQFRDNEAKISYIARPSMGWIYLTYLPNGCESVSDVISIINEILDAIARQYPGFVNAEKLIPKSYGSLHPTTFGTILYEKTKDHYVWNILAEPSASFLTKCNGDAFIWSVYMFDSGIGNLLVDENSIRGEEVIMRDLSTIILDDGYFKQLDRTLQAEPLKFTDMMHYERERVIPMQIILSKTYGLRALVRAIFSYTKNSTSYMSYFDSMIKEHNVPEMEWDSIPKLANILTWVNSKGGLESFLIAKKLQKYNIPPSPKATKKKKKATKAKAKADSDDEHIESESEPEPEEPVVQQLNPTDIRLKVLNNMDFNIDETRNDICFGCSTPLYGTTYVVGLEEKYVGFCEFCLDIKMTNPNMKVYKTEYPRTLNKVIRDPDFLQAARCFPLITDAERYISALKTISKADTWEIHQRKVSCTGNTVPTTYFKQRWQFRFKKGDTTVYMINDTAFALADFRLLKDPGTIIVLGGVLN
jgi:hypothetical protein